MNIRTFILVGLAMSLGTVVLAEDKSIYQGDIGSRVRALSSIQPGLGVIMHEIGYRTAAMYWAANGGNWGLAQYELKELLEAQEVAEVTRPNRAPMLKAFEENHLEPLGKAIEKQDTGLFNQRFAQTIEGCNGCHTALGFGFIRYRVPAQSGHETLEFNLPSNATYKEEDEPK